MYNEHSSLFGLGISTDALTTPYNPLQNINSIQVNPSTPPIAPSNQTGFSLTDLISFGTSLSSNILPLFKSSTPAPTTVQYSAAIQNQAPPPPTPTGMGLWTKVGIGAAMAVAVGATIWAISSSKKILKDENK